MNNTTVNVRNDDVKFSSSLEYFSTLQINNKMSASNDELLFYAAQSGDLAKLIDLLSKGTGIGFRDGVS